MRVFAATVIVLWAATLCPAQAGKKTADVVKLKAVYEKPDAKGEQLVTITLKVEKTWHIYGNPIINEDMKDSETTVTIAGPDKPETVKIDYPKAKTVKDKLVGDYATFEGEVVIKATIKRPAGAKGAIEVSAKVQACNDSSCLLPTTLKATAEEKK